MSKRAVLSPRMSQRVASRVSHAVLPCVSPRVSRRGATSVMSVLAMNIALATLLLGGGQTIRQVGGVHVDADGVVSQTPVEMRNRFVASVKEKLKAPSEEIAKSTEMRMVSLKALNLEIANAIKENRGELPADVLYMAGIQRIEHIFLYPEENDIVLAGPGEGWTVDAQGNVVGETTGLPVVHLEDFIVAMKSRNKAREGYGISCSIDPTAEGRRNFDTFMKKQRGHAVTDATVKAAEQAMGPQTISLTGVPETSRYAQVMVAADYRMKRIAMHLDPTPVKEVPSFLTIMKQKNASMNNAMPRWWLACNYEPVSRSEDGLAWKINGPGVKAMTEDELIGDDGSVKGTGKVNPLAQTWADNMTANYDQLMAAEPVFGDLRNVMDLSVVAALIEKQGMLDQVGLEIPMLADGKSDSLFNAYVAPTKVPTQCSYMKVRRGTAFTASGGVQIESWEVAANVKTDNAIADNREKAKPFGTTNLYWN